MLSPKMLQALNDQLQAEYFSSYLYLAMAARCADLNRAGVRALVPRSGAGGEPTRLEVLRLHPAPPRDGGAERHRKAQGDWPDAPTVVEDALKHEQYITQRIHNLVKLAREENDPATEAFLQWFVTVAGGRGGFGGRSGATIEDSGDSPSGLFIMDRELAKRQVGGAE